MVGSVLKILSAGFLLKYIFTDTLHSHFLHTIQKAQMPLKCFILVQCVYKSGYWYLTIVSIGFTGESIEQIVAGLSSFLPHEVLLQLKRSLAGVPDVLARVAEQAGIGCLDQGRFASQ